MRICYSYDPDFSEYNLSVTGHVVLFSVHLIALAFERKTLTLIGYCGSSFLPEAGDDDDRQNKGGNRRENQ